MTDAREALEGLAARASRAGPLHPDDDVYSYESAILAALDERDNLVEVIRETLSTSLVTLAKLGWDATLRCQVDRRGAEEETEDV